MTQLTEPVAALVDSLPGHQTPLWSLPGKPVGAYSAAADLTEAQREIVAAYRQDLRNMARGFYQAPLPHKSRLVQS